MKASGWYTTLSIPKVILLIKYPTLSSLTPLTLLNFIKQQAEEELWECEKEFNFKRLFVYISAFLRRMRVRALESTLGALAFRR